MSEPLKAAVVGTRGIGRVHARLLHRLEPYRLEAVCDLNPEAMSDLVAEMPSVKPYTNLAELLEESKPDVLTVATGNSSHFRLARMAVDAGVRGIYLEKPMTVHLGDARALVSACRESGTALAVNHQRRLHPELVTMRKWIADGAIGEVQLVRACCAGDFLSDGTHAVDSVRFLLGDPEAEWVCGQVFRENPPEEAAGGGFEKSGGRRFGHPVEDAALAVVGFSGGVRAEFFTGELFPPGRWYQDYEVFGTKGRLWRPSDGQTPALRIDRGTGVWEEVPIQGGSTDPIAESYLAFAQTVRDRTPHPLDGGIHGLANMEICSAVYESALQRKRVQLPLEADRFALETIVGGGR